MELRKDYILDRWVIISEKRGARPLQFKEQNTGSNDQSKCFFCPGHEHETPTEISRYPDHGDWEIRAFPNKFPFAAEEGQYDIKTDNDFFTFAQPFGKHEVLVETRHHNRQMWDLEEDELINVLRMYMKRIEDIYTEGKAKYVLILGQKEALDDNIIIREMKSGKQRTIALDKVVKEIKKKSQ